MKKTNAEIVKKYYHSPKGKETSSAYREENRKAIREYQRDYYARNPERLRNKQLKQWYGITLADYNTMFQQQNGFCLICGIHQSEVNKTFCVDHDHETGEVRGLLCDQCNKGLGHFKDNPSFLEKAADYLRRVLPSN